VLTTVLLEKNAEGWLYKLLAEDRGKLYCTPREDPAAYQLPKQAQQRQITLRHRFAEPITSVRKTPMVEDIR